MTEPRKHGNYIKKPKLSELEKPSKRKCLNCNQMFESEGPWNRICEPCKNEPHNFSKRMMNCSKVKTNGKRRHDED